MVKSILNLIIITSSVMLFLALFWIAFSIKNEITMKIKVWFSHEHDTLYRYLPSYRKMLWNPKRWSKKSWMKYIQKKIDDKW